MDLQKHHLKNACQKSYLKLYYYKLNQVGIDVWLSFYFKTIVNINHY